MLDILEASQVPQKQVSNRCKNHPEFDFDTICFHRDCVKKGQQIICSFCGQQEPHASHLDQQFAIHKASPGFRNWYKLPMLIRQRQQIAESYVQIKTSFCQLIEEISESSLKKLECFADLLNKNSIFKVCNKIRQNHQKHLDCCIEIINDMKKNEQRSDFRKDQACKLIEEKMQAGLKKQAKKIEILKSSLHLLFQSLSRQPYNKAKNINDKFKSEIIEKEFTKANLNPPSQFQENIKFSPEDGGSKNSLINQLLIFDKQPHFNSLEPSNNPEIPAQLKPPIGLDIDKGTFTIWNANPEVLNYLHHQKQIKHLIIQDSSLANNAAFQGFIKDLPKLDGIHLSCQSSISKQVLNQLKVPYLSFFPTYRFIQITDRSKYFPKVEIKLLDYLPIQYVNFHEKKRIKNRYFCGRQSLINKQYIDEINIIQNYSDFYRPISWTLKEKLSQSKRLKIIVFSNVTISKSSSLRQIYKNNAGLHTLIFEDCHADYNKQITQMKQLNPKQLKHFQISGDNLDKRIILNLHSIESICSNKSLQTLILTNLQFIKKQGRGRANNRSSELLSSLGQLHRLTYLNLFNSYPIQSRLLKQLHQNCQNNLKSLNIGCSTITSKQRFQKCPKFFNLQQLSLDYTQINQQQLARIMNNANSLKYLSIENLNGEEIVYQHAGRLTQYCKKYYGLITPNFFIDLHNKSLKYVNIYNCSPFSQYCWDGFKELECIRVNEGLLTQETINIINSKGIKLNIVKNDEDSCVRGKSIKKHCLSDEQELNQDTETFQDPNDERYNPQLQYIEVDGKGKSKQYKKDSKNQQLKFIE